ncbi:MAG: aminotransferase class IV [Flavobacteriales bacterium]
MNYILHNGTFLDSSLPSIYVSNRGFKYGDGFFESIRIIDGKPVFLENHYTRMVDGLKVYKIDKPVDFNLQTLDYQLNQLIAKNNISDGGRARITLTRKGEGFYAPDVNELEYVMETHGKADNKFTLNTSGLVVDLFPDIKKQVNKFSIFKTLNCQLYIHASLFARERMIDEALIQNEKMGIIESSTANLFLVSNGVLYTPGLVEGCVGGTMRMNVINLAIAHGIKVYECNLTPQNLLAADEIFLTNAIAGIQWVGSYRTKRYFNNTAKKVLDLLNESVKESVS